MEQEGVEELQKVIHKIQYLSGYTEGRNGSSEGGNFLQSKYWLFHRDCMPILGINHFTGEKTREERLSTYRNGFFLVIIGLPACRNTSLHSRLNGWIATQLFTSLYFLYPTPLPISLDPFTGVCWAGMPPFPSHPL